MNTFLTGLALLGVLFLVLILLPIAMPFVILIMVIAVAAWATGLASSRENKK